MDNVTEPEFWRDYLDTLQAEVDAELEAERLNADRSKEHEPRWAY